MQQDFRVQPLPAVSLHQSPSVTSKKLTVSKAFNVEMMEWMVAGAPSLNPTQTISIQKDSHLYCAVYTAVRLVTEILHYLGGV